MRIRVRRRTCSRAGWPCTAGRGRLPTTMAESRERTPEEREAARLERERRRRGEVPLDTDGAADGFDHDGDDDEVASGTRRVGWRERSAAGTVPPPPSRPRARAAPGRRRLFLRIAAVLVLALAAAVIWFCVQ